MKTFDEWFHDRHGSNFDSYVNGFLISNAMKFLAKELREYATYAAMYKEKE